MPTEPTQNPTLSDLQHEAVLLEALAEALSVLQDQSIGPHDCPIAKRARNSLSPAIDVVIEKAHALSMWLDVLDTAQRKAEREAA